MSFASLLRHTAIVSRRFAVLAAGEVTYDELGQPVTALLPLGSWRCRLEPLEAREVALLSQAGPVLSTHRVYGFPTDLEPADELSIGGRVFEVDHIDDAGGEGHHLEVLVTHIESEEPERS